MSASRNPLAHVLKWAGGLTALLSLVFALQQFTQLISETRERRRSTAELYRVGKVQQNAADYPAAWATFESALLAAEPGGQLAKLTGQLDRERRELRAAQEDLAMLWLENLRVSATRGETFTDAVAPLAAILTRGVAATTGARKADLLAHFGWANFLRWREGQRDLRPAQQYHEALAIDSLNPYAHAYLAHWLLWTESERALPQAREHFAAALQSGRARADVRRMQLAAIGNLGREGEADFVRLVTDLRRNDEPIDDTTRSRLYGIYWSACRPNAAHFDSLRAAVPVAEHVANLERLLSHYELAACRTLLTSVP